MKCEEAEQLIYLDNERSESESATLALHLKQCAKCTATATSFEGIRMGITAVKSEDIGPVSTERLTNRVMERINSPAPVKRKSLVGWLGIFRLGLSALSLFLIVSFYSEYSVSPTQPEGANAGQVTLAHSGGSATLKQPKEKRASLISLIKARKELLTNNDNNNGYETN